METWSVTKPATRSQGGLVAAQHRRAAEVGAEVLGAGGNAIDAAIATSLALAVLEPWMSGLGGGGLMVIAKGDGARPEVIDFAMRAPRALDPAAFPLVDGADDDLFGWPAVREQCNLHGPLSIAVPGQAAGLGLAHRTHARMPWAELCRPAIALAREGLPVTWHTSLRITLAARELARFNGGALYLPDGLPPVPKLDGTLARLNLGQLAATLERLAEAGPEDLLTGELAQLLVADLQAAGAALTLEDLRDHRARQVETLAIPHAGATIHTAPGLSAGPTLADALAQIQGKMPEGATGTRNYLAWAAALLAAYERRLATMGDVDDGPDPACTTHLCAVDGAGTMVSLTQTLLSPFGSKVISPQTGILLNNGIMWFDPRPDRPNSIAPGRRPLANMCPVIATREGAPWFALGASGGRRILPAVLQLASLLIDGALDLEAAFHTPRIDVSGGPTVLADQRLPPGILAALEASFPTRRVEPLVHPTLFACPSAVLREPASGDCLGMTEVKHPAAGVAAAPAPDAGPAAR